MNYPTCWKRLLVCCLLIVFGQLGAYAQDSDGITIQVVAVYEGSIYLDKGSADGVKEGDSVRIYAQDGVAVDAIVRSVSSHNTRCVADTGETGMLVGMHGFVSSPKQLALLSFNAPSIEESALAFTDKALMIVPVTRQAARAPGAIVRVAVRVTATSGAGLYLNQGRAAGIEPGDEVVLFPPGAGIENLVVLSVSRYSARCSTAANPQRINIDTRGEVLLPSDRLSEAAELVSSPKGNVPEHPSWSQTIESWDQNQPLLTPAYSRTREERDSKLYGRLYGQYLHTWNRHLGDNQYSLGRLGANIRYENPFHKGGRLRMNGQFNRRGIFLDDEISQVASPGWFNRISYRLGGHRGSTLGDRSGPVSAQ